MIVYRVGRTKYAADLAGTGATAAATAEDVLFGEWAAGRRAGTDDWGDDLAVHGTVAGPAGRRGMYLGRAVETGAAHGSG